jgi:hypothetical protein
MYPGSAKTGFVAARGEAAGVEAVKGGTSAAGVNSEAPVCLLTRFLAEEEDLRVAMGLLFRLGVGRETEGWIVRRSGVKVELKFKDLWERREPFLRQKLWMDKGLFV